MNQSSFCYFLHMWSVSVYLPANPNVIEWAWPHLETVQNTSCHNFLSKGEISGVHTVALQQTNTACKRRVVWQKGVAKVVLVIASLHWLQKISLHALDRPVWHSWPHIAQCNNPWRIYCISYPELGLSLKEKTVVTDKNRLSGSFMSP